MSELRPTRAGSGRSNPAVAERNEIVGEVSVLMDQIRGDPRHRTNLAEIARFGRWVTDRGLLEHQVWTLLYLMENGSRDHPWAILSDLEGTGKTSISLHYFALLHHMGKIPATGKYLIFAMPPIMAQFEDEIKMLHKNRRLRQRGRPLGGVQLVRSTDDLRQVDDSVDFIVVSSMWVKYSIKEAARPEIELVLHRLMISVLCFDEKLLPDGCKWFAKACVQNGRSDLRAAGFNSSARAAPAPKSLVLLLRARQQLTLAALTAHDHAINDLRGERQSDARFAALPRADQARRLARCTPRQTDHYFRDILPAAVEEKEHFPADPADLFERYTIKVCQMLQYRKDGRCKGKAVVTREKRPDGTPILAREERLEMSAAFCVKGVHHLPMFGQPTEDRKRLRAILVKRLGSEDAADAAIKYAGPTSLSHEKGLALFKQTAGPDARFQFMLLPQGLSTSTDDLCRVADTMFFVEGGGRKLNRVKARADENRPRAVMGRLQRFSSAFKDTGNYFVELSISDPALGQPSRKKARCGGGGDMAASAAAHTCGNSAPRVAPDPLAMTPRVVSPSPQPSGSQVAATSTPQTPLAVACQDYENVKRLYDSGHLSGDVLASAKRQLDAAVTDAFGGR